LNFWLRSNPQCDGDADVGDGNDDDVRASEQVFKSGFWADISVKKLHTSMFGPTQK